MPQKLLEGAVQTLWPRLEQRPRVPAREGIACPAFLMKSLLVFLLPLSLAGAEVWVAPAPKGEVLSSKFTVTVEGRAAPVYRTPVAPADRTKRMQAMDDLKISGSTSDEAAFVSFDFTGSVRVRVSCPDQITRARILPVSRGLAPKVEGGVASFTISKPGPLVLEVNGRVVETLQVFANAPETDVPKRGDRNVIYYGPGVHEVDGVRVGSGQTVYVAAGAVLRGKVGPADTQRAIFLLEGDGITLRGRGIIDGSLCAIHTRNLVLVRGRDIRLEGVILRDASVWAVPIRESDRVLVENLKLIGSRANSDGIDICNSRDVTVRDCFIRTLDDLVVVKTDLGKGKAERIVVRNCVLWNEVAHALSVGAELREDVNDVLFTDCDVVHDFGREWTMRVFHCDAARVSNVRFENIRIDDSPRLVSIWIGKAMWSRDEKRGYIDGVTFRNIAVAGGEAKIELTGYDAEHRIEEVTFDNVTVGGRPIRLDEVTRNEFVSDVKVTP